MPPNTPPSTYGTQLAGEILKTPLADWVQERRDAGKSWSAIAAELTEATNGQVTYTRQHLFRLYAPAVNGDAA